MEFQVNRTFIKTDSTNVDLFKISNNVNDLQYDFSSTGFHQTSFPVKHKVDNAGIFVQLLM